MQFYYCVGLSQMGVKKREEEKTKLWDKNAIRSVVRKWGF
jgi:hypothetical protein